MHAGVHAVPAAPHRARVQACALYEWRVSRTTAQQLTLLQTAAPAASASAAALIAQRVRAVCRERGHLTTLSGRRRYLPMLRSADRDLRAHAERRAINGSVQGSAADVVKGVMLEVDARLRASGMEPHCRLLLQVRACMRAVRDCAYMRLSACCWLGVLLELVRLPAVTPVLFCHPGLQLHDELLFEVRAEQLAPAAAIIHGVMEGAAAAWRLRVALPVRLSVGRSWGELQHVGADES